MELILLENILNLGNIGDKVIVKNGYGRNFLLKKGKALRFNKENLEYVSKKRDELNKKNLDLTNQKNVFRFLLRTKPKFIFIAAAKVGGIFANNKYKAEFINKFGNI